MEVWKLDERELFHTPLTSTRSLEGLMEVDRAELLVAR